MAHITQERLRELLDYDPETGVFTWRKKVAQKTKVGGVAGSLSSQGYIRIKLDGKQFAIHRLAWQYFYGEPPINDVDHINGNRSDNRIANLRAATRAENCRNRKPIKKKGLKGASPHNQTGKWQSHITAHGKSMWLGLFETEEAAHAAYCAASAKLHGEFGRVA